MRSITHLALVAGLFVAAGSACAETVASPGRLRMTIRSAASGPVCDRRGVGECQDGARSRAIVCDAFSDRLACADTVLSAQSACFRATGCD